MKKTLTLFLVVFALLFACKMGVTVSEDNDDKYFYYYPYTRIAAVPDWIDAAMPYSEPFLASDETMRKFFYVGTPSGIDEQIRLHFPRYLQEKPNIQEIEFCSANMLHFSSQRYLSWGRVWSRGNEPTKTISQTDPNVFEFDWMTSQNHHPSENNACDAHAKFQKTADGFLLTLSSGEAKLEIPFKNEKTEIEKCIEIEAMEDEVWNEPFYFLCHSNISGELHLKWFVNEVETIGGDFRCIFVPQKDVEQDYEVKAIAEVDGQNYQSNILTVRHKRPAEEIAGQ